MWAVAIDAEHAITRWFLMTIEKEIEFKIYLE
jgi:hypothetical protein